VAQAKPDGYEVLLGTVGTQAYSQTLYKKPLYSATRDFAPVVLVAEQPLVLVVRKDFPASSLKEFAAYAKANAAKLSFGSGGAGSATHLGCVLLNTKLGIKVQHVPYRGSAPALQDLMAGRIDYLCDAVSTELSPIKAASVRPIAMLTMRRTAVLPDVPTAKEQGFAVDANNWIGLFFPRGTPDDHPSPAGCDCRGDEHAGAAGAYGNDRHGPRRRRSHQLQLSPALRRQRDQEMGDADQGERCDGRLTRIGRHNMSAPGAIPARARSNAVRGDGACPGRRRGVPEQRRFVGFDRAARRQV